MEEEEEEEEEEEDPGADDVEQLPWARSKEAGRVDGIGAALADMETEQESGGGIPMANCCSCRTVVRLQISMKNTVAGFGIG